MGGSVTGWLLKMIRFINKCYGTFLSSTIRKELVTLVKCLINLQVPFEYIFLDCQIFPKIKL